MTPLSARLIVWLDNGERKLEFETLVLTSPRQSEDNEIQGAALNNHGSAK